jgi:hypothetical protein
MMTLWKIALDELARVREGVDGLKMDGEHRA